MGWKEFLLTVMVVSSLTLITKACPKLKCRLYCPFEYKLDTDGCQLCECNDRTEEKAGICPVVQPGTVGACTNFCESDEDCSGNEKCCSNGCGKACAEPEQSNAPVLCERYCPHGVDLDTRGRPTCTCSQPTVIHEGECPVTLGGTVGICADLCAHDGNCTSNQKCCSNGCGHICIDAIFQEKEGACPLIDQDMVGTCVQDCTHDMTCPGSQKCCSNGCGRTCVDPDSPSDNYRLGVCPTGKLTEGTMGVCADLCQTDFECPSHQKCCSNGCGHVCMKADALPVVHEGSCPVPPEGSEGVCLEECGGDGECAEEEKCCTNGCGRTCTAAYVTHSCPNFKCRLHCPFEYKLDTDGCQLCECNDRTEIHEGECPVVSADQVGTCVTSCDHDGSCPSNQKCCSNGCGQTCADAIMPDVSTKPGSCPAVDGDILGTCVESCSSDADCEGSGKCCTYGCGHTCQEPDRYVDRGSCPIGPLPSGISGVCSEMCSRDEDCGPSQKCCSNGCGHVCVTTVPTKENCSDLRCFIFCEFGYVRDDNGCETCSCESPPGVHGGECPVGLLPEGVLGTCSENCTADTECADGQKCCSNGCGHVCITTMTSSPKGICPDMMCLMWCKHGYQKDQYGCDTCYCTADTAAVILSSATANGAAWFGVFSLAWMVPLFLQ